MRLALIATCLIACTQTATPATDPATWQALHEPGGGGWITGLRVSPHDRDRVLLGGDMLGISVSEDRGATWQWARGLASYEVGDFTFHPGDPMVVWVGTMGGPYRSSDGGRSWEARRTGFPAIADDCYSAPIERIFFDPGNTERLLAIGGSRRDWSSPGKPLRGVVWESRDAGASWSQLSTIHAGGNIVTADIAADGRVLASVSGVGVFASEDGGRTWQPRDAGLPAPGNVETIIAHPRDRGVFWAAMGAFPEGDGFAPGGIYATRDGGRTWTAISAGLARERDRDRNFASSYKALAVSPIDPQVMWTCEQSWKRGILFRSLDGGASWQAVGTRGNVGHDDESGERGRLFQVQTAYFAGLSLTTMSVDPNDPQAVFGAGSEYCLRSLDQGASWLDVTATRIAGDAWRGNGHSGLCSRAVTFDPWRAGRVAINGMDAGKCWESLDGGASWVFHGHDPWPWGGGNRTVFAKDGTAYATTGQSHHHGSVLRFAPGTRGVTLHGSERGLPKFDDVEATGIHCLPDDSTQVWALLGSALYRSRDSGERWRAVPGVEGGDLAGDPTKPTRFYVSGRDNLQVTEDGETFTPLGGPHAAGRLAVDAKGRVLLATYRCDRPGLWRYANGVWKRLIEDAMLSNVAVDPSDPTRIAACFNDDPYHDQDRSQPVLVSVDDGRTWGPVAAASLPIRRGWALAFDPFTPGRLVFGSQGCGFFTTTLPTGWQPGTAGAYRYAGDTAADAAYAAVRDPRDLPIANGAMAEADGDKPLAWTQAWTGAGRLAITRDTTDFHTSPASLRIASVGGAAKGTAGQTFPIGPGRATRVRGWVKTAGEPTVNVALQCFDKDWKSIGFLHLHHAAGASDWREFTGEVTTPPGTTNAILNVLLEGDGTAWLDDVR